jgi:hypothetical protein
MSGIQCTGANTRVVIRVLAATSRSDVSAPPRSHLFSPISWRSSGLVCATWLALRRQMVVADFLVVLRWCTFMHCIKVESVILAPYSGLSFVATRTGGRGLTSTLPRLPAPDRLEQRVLDDARDLGRMDISTPLGRRGHNWVAIGYIVRKRK